MAASVTGSRASYFFRFDGKTNAAHDIVISDRRVKRTNPRQIPVTPSLLTPQNDRGLGKRMPRMTPAARTPVANFFTAEADKDDQIDGEYEAKQPRSPHRVRRQHHLLARRFE
jgi:hypothetical protein